MKLDEIKQLEVTRIGNTEEGIKANISQASFSYIFEILTKGFYSNAIGSLVREITSNCFDSHIEAGVTDPVIINKSYNIEEGYSIEFKDVGIGLSQTRIAKIYMNYFSSTKRETNEQIGGFGLGSKTPLAYADLFYITTNYDGKQYELIMHRGEESPQLESLHGWTFIKGDMLTIDEVAKLDEDKYIEEINDHVGAIYYEKIKVPEGIDTEERNGTVIRVNMQNDDVETFKKELKNQLAYFDDVYFNNWGISNDYDIYEGKYFKFRSDISQSGHRHNYRDEETELHIVLGKVRYPIDFSRIKVPSNYRNIPIAVKFDIGELRVTPNRENLRYNDHDIKLITRRIELAVEELKHLYTTQNPIIEDLADYNSVMDATPKITFNEGKNHYLYIWANAGLDKAYRFKPLVNLGIKTTPKNLFFMYEVIGFINNKGKRHMYQSSSSYVDNNFILKNRYVYVSKEDRQGSIYTDHRIAEEHGKGTDVYIIRRKKLDYKVIIDKLGMSGGAKDVTSLGKAKTIQEYVKIIAEEVKKRGKAYISLKADDLWIRDFKKRQKESSLAYQRKVANKIFVRSARLGFSGQDVPAAELKERTGILVYGFREDKAILESIWKTVTSCHKGLRDKLTKVKELENSRYNRDREKYDMLAENFDKAFQVIIIAKSNLDELVGPKKTIYWENFLTTLFMRKLETAARIRLLMQEMNLGNLSIRSKLIKNFSKDRQTVLDLIEKYNSVKDRSLYVIPTEYLTGRYIDSMMKIFYDFKKKQGGHIPLIDALRSDVMENSIALEGLIAYLKSMKIRLENKYYGKPSSYLIELI